jgi:2-keto-3-deoxy-galactonokinase
MEAYAKAARHPEKIQVPPKKQGPEDKEQLKGMQEEIIPGMTPISRHGKELPYLEGPAIVHEVIVEMVQVNGYAGQDER